MPSPEDLKTQVRTDVPLAEMTTFGIGGPARYYAEVTAVEELVELLRWARKEDVPVFVIGGGSNILVSDDGMDALVIRLKDTAEFGRIEFGEEDGQQIVTVGAAVKSAVLVRTATERGFSGVEFLTGIPGTVGGAVACDAGGRFGRMHDVLVGFSGLPFAIEKRDKGLFWLDRVRDAESFLVCSVILRVSPSDPDVITKRIQEITDHRRNTQPEGVRSAGCFFRNPPGELSAGKLIDMAGLKGKKRGGAEVSKVHANYIVNTGNATAYDVVGLAVEVAEIVREQFKVKLAFEVDLWGESLEELIAGKGYF